MRSRYGRTIRRPLWDIVLGIFRAISWKFSKKSPDSVKVRVKRVNADAPIQLRLLCTLTADWPENFKPCSSEFYQELGHEQITPGHLNQR